MDRKETDQEARATKNTKKVWGWVLGAGIILMAFAFWGGFFNHSENFSEAETPAETKGVAPVDTTASDTTMEVHPDTIMKSVRGTQ